MTKHKEVIANTRFEAHERLLKAVLDDAERKKEETERLSINLAKYLPPYHFRLPKVTGDHIGKIRAININTNLQKSKIITNLIWLVTLG